jgi:biotin transport system substrate-specific component
VILIVLGALFVAVLAQVKIPLPFTPVPLTGQTFAVLLVGATLGSKRSLMSMLLYIALGTLGLSVFAGGASGMAYLSGATLGYLVGFVMAAYVIGLLAERGLERNVRTSILHFLVGTAYLLGGVALTSHPEVSAKEALVGPFSSGYDHRPRRAAYQQHEATEAVVSTDIPLRCGLITPRQEEGRRAPHICPILLLHVIA